MKWRSDPSPQSRLRPSRRQFIGGAAAAGGLALGYAFWPRRFAPNLAVNGDEVILNGCLKLGGDGHIVVVVPQLEFGQAASTILPQIVADELGADWRTIGVEFAPVNALYANHVFADAIGWQARWPWDAASALQITDPSTLIAAHATPMRLAAAAARDLLAQAAAARWRIPAAACDTAGGFVTHGAQKLRFADLAHDAARLTPTEPVPVRQGDHDRLMGVSLPRLDAPAKIDGSANFAADIRLPDMVFACVHQGPMGATRLKGFDAAAARAVPGAVEVVALDDALACVGVSSWAAAQMLNAARPSFVTRGRMADTARIGPALDAALAAPGQVVRSEGDVAALPDSGRVSATFRVALLAHADLEPMAATARAAHGLVEVWATLAAPDVARHAIADALDLRADAIVLHPVFGSGTASRRCDPRAAVQAARLAVRLRRPVQLFWSRGEDMMHDCFAGGVSAKMSALVQRDGTIIGWDAAIATPAPDTELRATLYDARWPIILRSGQSPGSVLHAAADAVDPHWARDALPPYAIANARLTIHPVAFDVPTGTLRGGARLWSCFFNESLINQLAQQSGVEPLSFRMALLGNNPRLAQCIAKAGALAGWAGGGQGGNQGLACHVDGDGCIAVIAEAALDEGGRAKVSKLTAVADLGQAVNPDIARQHIEGGLLHGLSVALGSPARISHGIVGPQDIAGLHLPTLAQLPEIVVEMIPSNAPSADSWDLAAPPLAPAVAAALFASTGKRINTLPLTGA